MMISKILVWFIVLFGVLCSHAFTVYRYELSPRHVERQKHGLLSLSSSSTKEYIPSITEEDQNSFMEKLLVRLHQNDKSPVVVEGYVIAKRSIGKNLVFLDFQVDKKNDKIMDDDRHLCQALLRKDIFTGGFYEGYRRCLLKGCKFRLTGVASPTKIPGNVVLMLHSMELLALPRQPQHIQIILQQALDGAIPMKEVAQACSGAKQNAGDGSPVPELESMFKIERSKTTSQDLKVLAKHIFSNLPDDPYYPAAVDQKALSKQGNFNIPLAPKELQIVPKQLRKDAKNSQSKHDEFRDTSRIKETILEITNMVNKDGGRQIDETFLNVSITGWVQNRRRFEKNITMIHVVDSLNPSFINDQSLDRIPCLVHPNALFENYKLNSGVYQNLIGWGSKVKIEGKILLRSATDSERTTRSMSSILLWVQKIRLVRSSYRPTSIRYLLDLLYQKRINTREASEALLIPYEEATELSLQSDATQRQWMANSLAVRLQKESSSENNSMRRVDPALLNVLEKYLYLSKIHPVVSTNIEGKLQENETSSEKRKHKRIPIGMPGSRWQIKKKPQLQWMGDQIRQVLESHPDYTKRKLNILDIGGGKGALANYLGQSLGHHVQIHVVDISQGAVKNGQNKAERLDLPVDFQFADASNSDLLHSIDADVVVSLHGCGHLSDVALNHAVHRKAGFVIVPCCFNSNPHLLIPSKDSSDSKNTTLTPVPDWLGLPTGDWAALKLLCEVQDDIPLSQKAIGVLCAIRAEAVKNKMSLAIRERGSHDDDIRNVGLDRAIAIKSFPIQYSTRNIVLVGKCS